MASRRGQQALEFLTTYGWAFLVVLVMIGSLWYFGVINPCTMLPEMGDCAENNPPKIEEITCEVTPKISTVVITGEEQEFYLAMTCRTETEGILICEESP